MKMEILLESTSKQAMVRSSRIEGILQPDWANDKDHIIRPPLHVIAELFYGGYVKWWWRMGYEHVGPEVASPQVGKVARWRIEIVLVDDSKGLQEHYVKL
ncbi:hypothetical protein Tco_0046459 [Tanacetum coccineum]